MIGLDAGELGPQQCIIDALAGMRTRTSAAASETSSAFTPLSETRVAFATKPVPVIVTTSPLRPIFGMKSPMDGGCVAGPIRCSATTVRRGPSTGQPAASNTARSPIRR